MTIYAPAPPAFDCAICGDRHTPDRWRMRCDGTLPIAPLCRRCEIAYGGGQYDRNRDHRMIRQVKALATALDCEAYRQTHERGRHARA